jgi:hypothetical protein
MPQQAPLNVLRLLKSPATLKHKYLVLVQAATSLADSAQKMMQHPQKCMKQKINKLKHQRSKVYSIKLLVLLKVNH